MVKKLILHPILFAIFPIVALFAHNIRELLPSITVVPLIVGISLSAISWLILSRILKDINKASILISFSVLMFFSYGHIRNLLNCVEFNIMRIGKHIYFLPIWSAILFIGIYLILKTERSSHSLTARLNIISAFLVLISLIRIGGEKTLGDSNGDGRAPVVEVALFFVGKGEPDLRI